MTPLAALRFRHPFRRYQRMVLELVAERERDRDRKFHIVAPPGSGKTIIGLELIRRFGRPAVVFCPTTTIQRQWREKVGLFTKDPTWIGSHTSLNPRRLATINILTYQVLSTPGENLEFVERIALDRWMDDLLSSDQVRTEAQARQRIAALREANPKAYRREVAKRYRRVKRDFLREGKLAGREFLHPNARNLIDRIVALGTGTVVLDECHHLLDYWAFILRELILTLPDVRVIGLTATLPDPANKREYENYTALLGEVDFEVPTPAVVKEGNLAPYRDLVYFCEPSPREQDYLRQIQRHFAEAVWRISRADAFRDWLWGLLFPDPADPVAGFEETFRREPLLCIAAVKYLREQGVFLPLEVPIIEEMLEPLGVDDWLTLMEHYALRALKVSADPHHQALYGDLCDALLPFGITISERGIRHSRSPGDLVLALSEAKDAATVDILRAEAQALAHRLRAVVLTDYERLSARTRRLKGILDPDAGSAVRVFRRLVADPVTGRLLPVLVTGKMVLIAAQGRALLEEGIRRWVEQHRADLRWRWKATESEDVLRLVGQGPDWSSRTYVALLTDLFEEGVTRCLVGTRAIFGEGWDSLRLNTLIDLTSVTTRTGVRQIRGRTLRLDPTWPRKVAHNWDVVCISRRFDKGDADLRRFITRHRHIWGIVGNAGPRSGPQGAGRRLGWSALQGRIVRGVAHVDPRLAADLALRDFRRVDYGAYTRRSLEAVWERDRVYDLWAVGQPYDNTVYSISQVQGRDLKFRTSLTVQRALGAVVRRTVGTVLFVGGLVWVNGALIIPWATLHALPQAAAAATILSGAVALAMLGVNGYGLWQVFRRAFLELPADAVLDDMGRALLAALRQVGVIGEGVGEEQVRVVETEQGYYRVFLAEAAPEESDAFVRAYQQMLGPPGDARYLIERDGASLHNWAYRPLWFLVRKMLRLEEDLKAYHRVPDLLANRRERAEALARHWRRYVGGGRLIYTRTVEGRRILLAARAQQHGAVRQMAFEIWR